jgi:hypothetical protein
VGHIFDTKTAANSHAHHQRATTPNSKTTKYDPDTCRSSWITYIDNDLSTISAWRSRDIQLHDWRRKHAITTLGIFSTRWETDIETIWKPVPTQCDGIPRVTSFSEVARGTTSHSSYDETTVYDSPLPVSDLPNPWMKEVPPFPACEIHPGDCQHQWAEFSLAFANYTLTSKQLRFDHWPEYDVFSCTDIICEPDIPWSLDAWLKFREYESYRGFFSSCPQPADQCLKPYVFKNITENELPGIPSGVWISAEKLAGCEVAAERFVLIFFAPEDPPQIDRCTTQAQNSVTNVATHGYTKNRTATLESIVFGEKQRMFGFNIPAYQLGNSKLSIGMYNKEDGYPEPDILTMIESISASTMYNTNKWTFTSPSVYLAYDTVLLCTLLLRKCLLIGKQRLPRPAAVHTLEKCSATGF